jgi:16S rRNA (cytidine1402-2'-O)-methyltransferase
MLVSTLYIVATPIGNLEDISLRAVRILGEVDALACEDTRHTRILFEKHGIRSPRTIFSYREQNEEAAGDRILGLLESGASVALCTDAGTPGISDPGYRVISRAVGAGYSVQVIPGADAVLTALLSSGLPTSSFTFKGFPPKKPGPRRRFLEMEKEAPHTLVLYESPFRVHALLAAAREALGNRRAAVCLELTKQFERVHRGTLEELCREFQDRKVKGEAAVVIAGSNPKFTFEEDRPEDGGRDGEDRGSAEREESPAID